MRTDYLQELSRKHDARKARHADTFRSFARAADKALTDRFAAFVKEKETARRRRAEYERPMADRLAKLLVGDGRRGGDFDIFQSDIAEQSVVRAGSPLIEALTLRPTGGGKIEGFIFEDQIVDVVGPPYADQWTSTSGNPSPHAQQMAWGNKQDGSFGFLHWVGGEGGWADSAGAVWVDFVPNPMGQAQVRAYTPYDYIYRDESWISTTHNDAGFGIFVLSWDFAGGDQTVEQDFRYSTWSESTSGIHDDNHSPSAPAEDNSYAYIYGNEAPYFNIRPDRLYRAAIWCFGSCDAAGDSFLSPGQAQAKIGARVGFVVIGQQ